MECCLWFGPLKAGENPEINDDMGLELQGNWGIRFISSKKDKPDVGRGNDVTIPVEIKELEINLSHFE